LVQFLPGKKLCASQLPHHVARHRMQPHIRFLVHHQHSNSLSSICEHSGTITPSLINLASLKIEMYLDLQVPSGRRPIVETRSIFAQHGGTFSPQHCRMSSKCMIRSTHVGYRYREPCLCLFHLMQSCSDFSCCSCASVRCHQCGKIYQK
jgi:hypothetical protein